jgi:hypothetical protein
VNPLEDFESARGADVWDAMRSNFHGDQARFSTSDGVALLLFALALALGFWLLSRALAQQARRRPYNNPRRLFRELARAHRLSRADRGLLRDLAGFRQIQPAARVFIEPLAFEAHGLNARLQRRSQRLSELQRLLFAEAERAAGS